MAYENLIVEREDNVGIITLNRPPANPINLALLEELDAVFTEWAKDKTVRAVIITGAGVKGFSAGFDLKTAGTPDGEKAMWRGQEVFSRIEKYPKPVIAAMNGFALGGGCELAMSCHFRIMVNSERVVAGQPEIDVGIIPGWGGTQRLPRLVGKSRALEMMLLGTRISAPEALSIGLITRMSEPGKVMDDARELAKSLAKKAPIAVQVILDAVTRGLETGIDQGMKIELEGSQRVQKTKDAVEGIMAFVEKREAVFKGE
ncbi:MAG: enoyl-CoA hydratase/isomerase family protein [Dehalococcoidia bacterium]|nr:enoyl-CoA hydratase/isomerase family protein [Dehalococcoidia bacterium]